MSVPSDEEVLESGEVGDTRPGDSSSEPGASADRGGHKSAVGAGALSIGALGVVFGDIWTSPLYAFREAIEHQHLDVTRRNSMGVASIAFWALIVIISAKCIALVMKAQNHGEGGILALTALIMPKSAKSRTAGGLVMLGVFGTALLYGDGLITPAISVLSAVEGFRIASSAFETVVIPLTCVILVALFLVQRRGTHAIGKVFGPVMVVWFTVLGLLGLLQIVQQPGVLGAVNPIHIVNFFAAEPLKAFLALGSIFLVVTGGEALYADMGHFGRRPIAIVWYSIVLPGLLLNYFGQAALRIRNPTAIESPFYRMAPEWAITPLAVLATMASVIASQALISGAFSLTLQAVQLDYLPRVAIRHTSRDHQGQVYVPLVNWALMIGCVGLVIAFRTSSNLAAAYGIAVTSVMMITTILIAVVARRNWGWSRAKTAIVMTPLLAIDTGLLAANVPKIPQGGWFPLAFAVVLLAQMSTWRKGRQLVAARIHRGERPIDEVLDEFHSGFAYGRSPDGRTRSSSCSTLRWHTTTHTHHPAAARPPAQMTKREEACSTSGNSFITCQRSIRSSRSASSTSTGTPHRNGQALDCASWSTSTPSMILSPASHSRCGSQLKPSTTTKRSDDCIRRRWCYLAIRATASSPSRSRPRAASTSTRSPAHTTSPVTSSSGPQSSRGRNRLSFVAATRLLAQIPQVDHPIGRHPGHC